MMTWRAVVGPARWVWAQRLVIQLTAAMVVLIQVAILFQALSRGLDYVGLPSDLPTVRSLLVVEQIIPLKLAGWVYFGAAVGGFLGMCTRQVPLAAMSHFVLMVAYWLFATGSYIEIFQREGELTGWRTASSWVVAGVLHGVFAVASEFSWRVARAK